MNGEDYNDYVMENLYEEGQELGLEGQELLDYVEEQFEQRGV
tara:strand:+ start:582 stop:707 length:126 start_codon:yes stop_codon:yes gene_type:complete